MPTVRSCAHCYRIYCPHGDPDSQFCDSCRSGIQTLETEIADSLDPYRLRESADRCLDRLHRPKRRLAVFPPASLAQLLAWLSEHPHVRITGPVPWSAEIVSRDEVFLRYGDGSMWFRNHRSDTHIPLHCLRSEAAAASETGIEFDGTGFTVSKFGTTIRVEYLP